MATRPLNPGSQIYNFEVTTESSLQKDNHNIFIFVKVNLSEEPERAIHLASFIFVCIFEIENYDEVVTLNDNGLYTIDYDLEMYLRSASISTSRGIIWCELKGSYLHNAVMPVIDVRSLQNLTGRQIINEKGEVFQK